MLKWENVWWGRTWHGQWRAGSQANKGCSVCNSNARPASWCSAQSDTADFHKCAYKKDKKDEHSIRWVPPRVRRQIFPSKEWMRKSASVVGGAANLINANQITSCHFSTIMCLLFAASVNILRPRAGWRGKHPHRKWIKIVQNDMWLVWLRAIISGAIANATNTTRGAVLSLSPISRIAPLRYHLVD